MTSIANILHNIADHTRTLWLLASDTSVSQDVVGRLKQHMMLEEQENTFKLQAMHEQAPSAITQKLIDHSYFLQQMMQEETMSLELKKDLLDHFSEEHQEWIAEISPNENANKWTVGPLWPQGG